jgi:hypothetical protein
MPRPCYSTIFEQHADLVWSVIRDFGHYSWAGVPSDTIIEDGRTGDSVGCIRAVRLHDRTIRQQLLAHSDLERCYTLYVVPSAAFAVPWFRGDAPGHADHRWRSRVCGMVSCLRLCR